MTHTLRSPHNTYAHTYTYMHIKAHSTRSCTHTHTAHNKIHMHIRTHSHFSRNVSMTCLSASLHPLEPSDYLNSNRSPITDVAYTVGLVLADYKLWAKHFHRTGLVGDGLQPSAALWHETGYLIIVAKYRSYSGKLFALLRLRFT